MTDVRLQEMLKEGNYAGATRLCLECLTAVPLYKQYTCISDLGSKLKDTQNVIEVNKNTYHDITIYTSKIYVCIYSIHHVWVEALN